MSNPLVTIGLPVYNGENYLSEAIDSLLSQTFTDFRLIITDNASDDATGEIARDAASRDQRVEYHRQKRNLGAAANYNFAVDQARSPFFMWHAHDDLRGPQFIEKAVEAFERRPEASIVFSRARLIGPEGLSRKPIARPDGLLSPLPEERLRAAITCTAPDIVLFGLMRRDLLVTTGKHGSFKGGDRLLVAEMALLGPLVELSEPLFFNRDHPDRYVRISSDRADRDEKSAWWDTSLSGKVAFPRWRGLQGYFRAVGRTPRLDLGTRAKAYLAIAASLLDNRFYLAKQLMRDVFDGGFELLSRIRRVVSSRRST